MSKLQKLICLIAIFGSCFLAGNFVWNFPNMLAYGERVFLTGLAGFGGAVGGGMTIALVIAFWNDKI